MPLTLRQLKNKYATETGRIRRELGDTKEAKLAQIQLKNRISFETYLAFLSVTEVDEKESHLEFLDSIRHTDVPADALLCAAVYSAMDSASALSSTRSEYGGDLDFALQWAIIQFLDESNPLKDENWLAIIIKLLDLGADPRVESTHLSHIISAGYFVTDLSDLKSAFLMALFFKTKNQHTLELLELFSKYPGVKLSDTQINLIFSIDKDDKSVLIQRPWFNWLEKNLFQQTQRYLKKNECDVVYHLALNEDFESLTHLEVKHSVDVFGELLKRTVINHHKSRLPLKPTLCYLELYHSDKLAAFLIERKDDSSVKYFFINNDFLDTLQRLTRDPTSHAALIIRGGNLTDSKAFRWLETNNPNAIRTYLNTASDFPRGVSDDRTYLANSLNIDCYYLLTIKRDAATNKDFSAKEKTSLAPFYQQRAKFVLDFMFNQSFSTGSSRVSVFHEGKCMTGLSDKLQSIFTSLQTVLKCPKEKTADACMEVYVAAKNSIEPDPIEKEFLSALASGLTDKSSLSQYVQRQFDIQRICVPFLTGLRSNARKLESKDESKGDSKAHDMDDESSIFRASQNVDLWDRKLVGEIFRFLGFDPPRQKPQEAKHSLPPAPNWP